MNNNIVFFFLKNITIITSINFINNFFITSVMLSSFIHLINFSYITYTLRDLSYLMYNPSHIFEHLIVLSSFLICFIFKFVPSIYIKTIFDIILITIQIPYICYNNQNLTLKNYHNFIDFFNNNYIIYLGKSIVFILMIHLLEYHYYFYPLLYLYISIILIFHKYIRYRDFRITRLNLLYIPEEFLIRIIYLLIYISEKIC